MQTFSQIFFKILFRIFAVRYDLMTQKHYISVILPLKLEWEPCYYTTENIFIGERVKVIFKGKRYNGVVSGIDITPDIDVSRVLEIESIEKDMPAISPEELELWKQVAQYYMCSIGEVFKAAYPTIKINMEQARAEARAKVHLKRTRALESMEAKLEKLEIRLVKKQEQLDRLKDGTKSKANCVSDIEKIKTEITLAKAARDAAESSLAAAEKGNWTNFNSSVTDSVILSEAQENAIGQILKGMETGKPVMLHGATGSGKTEIYIKLAQRALKSGKNVLYLVPEIALSRQLEERLQNHFGDRLLIFHSMESAVSRRNSSEAIRELRNSEGNYIALCTRSGLFLPHHNLGLIVVDEEHDSSYKQDSPAPRYNGRDTALMMSRIHKGCDIILGSATPSLEEIYNTSTGKHVLVRLAEKYHGTGESDIEIIDTRAERKKNGMTGSFSRKLIDHIKNALQSGEQVLILRSRRAWATSLQCDDCGEIQKCPHCNVSMSLHKFKGHMVCHCCGHMSLHTGQCGKCSGHLSPLGAGTQKIEEEAAVLFPEATIARLDSDSAAQHGKIIKDFAAGKINILIGTQMIGKGFDFSNLNLVAVISADTMLGIQDFRADEKAYHLLEQFRGRCGRREKKGLFVIQTSQPEHPLYSNLSETFQEDFNIRLLAERHDFSFPPYSRIVEISIKDRIEERAGRMADKLERELGRFNVTGPYTPVVDKVADEYIRMIRILLPKDRQLSGNKTAIGKIIADFEKKFKYDGHITIDVDPS